MPNWLSSGPKDRLRKQLRNAKSAYHRWRYAFSKEDLLVALRRIGVQEGDSLLVHSSFAKFEGFRGTAVDVIDIFETAVGPSGLLVMPTLPFSGSAIDYAAQRKIFDLRTTPSRMGLLTEVFRRSEDVLRSVHPTHPVAVWGAGKEQFIEGHHLAKTPCGAGSPYYRLLDRGGKILLAGVDISVLTFYHTVEEILEPEMPFSPFTVERFTFQCRTAAGLVETAPMRLFARAVLRRRNLHMLMPVLQDAGRCHETRVGGLDLTLLEADHVLGAVRTLAAQNVYCYETT